MDLHGHIRLNNRSVCLHIGATSLFPKSLCKNYSNGLRHLVIIELYVRILVLLAAELGVFLPATMGEGVGFEWQRAGKCSQPGIIERYLIIHTDYGFWNNTQKNNILLTLLPLVHIVLENGPDFFRIPETGLLRGSWLHIFQQQLTISLRFQCRLTVLEIILHINEVGRIHVALVFPVVFLIRA